MNKPLKLSSSKTKLLWISDQHQQHQPSWKDTPPLWKSRGFTSIDDHDSWLRDQWHKLVDEDTVVFDLGDRVFSDSKGERFRQTTMWPGRQYHVWGNHRSGATQIYRQGIEDMFSVFGPSPLKDGDCRYEVYPITVNNLTFVGESMHVWVDGYSIYMQHYAPYIWPEIGHGGGCCCGHSHSSCAPLNPDNKEQGAILDIGLDNAIKTNGTPFFTAAEVLRILRAKGKKVKDHHRGDVPGQ
jgi:calcineurin-like phosphoesterase family protein